MTQCARDGCDREATHYPVIYIPAIGYRPDKANCVESPLCNVNCCEEHAADSTFAATVPVKVQRQMNGALRAAGKQCADWKRAFVEAHPLGDALWLAFQDMLIGKPQ